MLRPWHPVQAKVASPLRTIQRWWWSTLIRDLRCQISLEAQVDHTGLKTAAHPMRRVASWLHQGWIQSHLWLLKSPRFGTAAKRWFHWKTNPHLSLLMPTKPWKRQRTMNLKVSTACLTSRVFQALITQWCHLAYRTLVWAFPGHRLLQSFTGRTGSTRETMATSQSQKEANTTMLKSLWGKVITQIHITLAVGHPATRGGGVSAPVLFLLMTVMCRGRWHTPPL